LGLKRSLVLDRIHRRVNAGDSPLQHLYEELRTAETRNFFPHREALDEFLARPGMIDRYLRGEFGINHIFTARTAALLTLFDVVANITRDAVRTELEDHDLLDATLECYIDELLQVVIASKTRLTDVERSTAMTLHFDFSALHAADYLADPRRVFIADGLRFVIQHTESQRADLRKYFAQYGEGSEGIAWFLQRNDSHLGAVLYRTIEYGEPFAGMDPPIEVPVATVAPVANAATTARRVLWAKPVDR
jgi:hypothetical protein